MVLQGEAKKAYQKEYMRRMRSNKKNNSGLTTSKVMDEAWIREISSPTGSNIELDDVGLNNS